MAYTYVPITPNIFGIPQRVPRKGIKTLDDLNKEITEWSSKVGEDSQLQNVNLQNALQRLQQVIQTMTNVSKSHHDTQKAIINNIKS
ncbi:hypothetical protein [Algibacter sp. 2305UL17-15]|uniref:hypothetical protein n=1 Tax=Algibacter sp. 2305UL17-15 TaxID=3231268 RepID=UPI003457C0DF